MTRRFLVTVHPMRIQIEEVETQFVVFDARARVDGDIWLYKIKKHVNIPKNDKRWRGRAYHNIHYHAHNSGHIVSFSPVHHQRRKDKKMSEKQLSFW